MRLKLSKAEMEALAIIAEAATNLNANGSLANKMLWFVFDALLVKVQKKLLERRSNYSISIDDVTCLSVCIFFSEYPLKPQVFEENFLLKLINQFKQHYA